MNGPVNGTAIEVGALTMSYAGRDVLTGVDFEVKAGEVFCLLGPNGAGKTTTIEILEGFRQRTGGMVSVLGMDPQTQPAGLRERIGIVLQECGFPRQARVAELIDSWRGYYSRPRELEDLLKVVELTQDRNVQVRRLSGGQRRRLDLALALAGDPDLIFLDEPTTGFDPESRRRCWAAIKNLRALGKTVVLTTHYLDEAEHLADRVAILQAGRIQVAGTVRQVARRAGVKTKIKFTAPERVLAGALAPPRCLEVVVHGEVATCHTDNSGTALRELLGWAAANDLGDLADLSVETPTLEDAYLELVSPPMAKTAILPGARQADIPRGDSLLAWGAPAPHPPWPPYPPKCSRRTQLSRTVSLAFRQALLEQRSFWRSAEYALFTFALPIALLLLIGSTTATGDLPGTHVEGQMIFVPSIIAFGVIVAAYVNLGAKLATLRHDGVLKRIRTTPLPAGAYLSGVLGSTAATTMAITASIIAIGALAFRAVPRAGGLPELAGGLVLGVVCFGALGLALSAVAGSAESASPIANFSYLPLAIMSGIFDPTFPVPHWLSAAVGLFPVRALAQVLQQSYTPVAHAPATDLIVLLAWTAAAAAFTAWRFRWH